LPLTGGHWSVSYKPDDQATPLASEGESNIHCFRVVACWRVAIHRRFGRQHEFPGVASLAPADRIITAMMAR